MAYERFRPKSRRRRILSATGIAVICAFVALLLLIFFPRENARVQVVQNIISDGLGGAYELAALPFQAWRDWRDGWQDLMKIREENSELRVRNSDLEAQLLEMDLLQQQLKKLQKLLALPTESRVKIASARVVADFNSPFVHTVLANSGEENGIEAGQVVIGGRGLIGRVLSVSEETSRILLLTDFNSHIPVITTTGKTRAILSGRNRTNPVLEFVAQDENLEDGVRLITSGDGGQIPSGIPVGIVRLREDASPIVMLDEDLTHIDYVRIILASPKKFIAKPR